MQEKVINIDGHKVAAYSMGPSKSKIFFLVHGIGVSHRYFIKLMHTLGKNYRVVAIDLPGFGKSSRPDKALNIADHAAILGKVIMHEKLSDALLIGHSMGCQVVSELARQQPKLATKIVLMGPTISVQKGKLLRMRHFWNVLQDSLKEPIQLNKIVLKDYIQCGLPRYLATLKHMISDRLEDRLKDTLPHVLVLRGANDPIVSDEWAKKAARIAGGEFVEIPNAAHAIQFSQPEIVADLCERFAEK
jgi:pimeloyl-ACP methyl ester carboxylesterase